MGDFIEILAIGFALFVFIMIVIFNLNIYDSYGTMGDTLDDRLNEFCEYKNYSSYDKYQIYKKIPFLIMEFKYDTQCTKNNESEIFKDLTLQEICLEYDIFDNCEKTELLIRETELLITKGEK